MLIPANSKSHGNHHPEYDKVPVLAAEAHQETGKGEGESASRQQNCSGQVFVEEVRENGQQDRGEDEYLDEGGASENLEDAN